MTVDEALGYSELDQYAPDPVVGVLAAEVRRLREESAGRLKKIECLRVARDAIKDNWATERAATEAERQSADKLRAEIAETQSVSAMQEVARLQAVVADQALTIGTLKDALASEQSLTAATAEHTTALERKVAELQEEAAQLRRSVATMACNHKGIGLVDCRICDPLTKPGATP